MLASHELVFQTLFAQVEDTAFSQALIPLESPGLKIEREVKGIDYIYWRRTLAGRREEHLLGPQSLAQKICSPWRLASHPRPRIFSRCLSVEGVVITSYQIKGDNSPSHDPGVGCTDAPAGLAVLDRAAPDVHAAPGRAVR